MHRISRLSLVAGCAAAAAAASATAAHACSLAPFPISRDGVHLIGTATADTLPAGAAGMEYELGPEAEDGPIYGQVVRVERLGGADAASLPPGTDRLVLVPWGYGPDCRTTRWSASAHWVQPGERGLFWAGLRPREQWVDGLPTLDVGQPYQLPYPQRAYEDDPDSLMTVEQAFELIDLLPLWDEFEADPEEARQPLLRWARANPDLARRFPASVVVNQAEHDIRYATLKRIDPPLAGTYRFSVSVDGDSPRPFYARTRSAPTTEWDPVRSPAADDWEPPAPGHPIAGYTLLLAASASVDSLPVVCGPDRDMGREGYVSVAAAPESGPDGVQVWTGQVELNLAASALPADSVLVGITRSQLERMMERVRADLPMEERVHAPARFLLRPDGSVAVEQTVVLHDGRTVVITGERLSRVTIPDPG
jgi:hypothetical protein